MSVTSSPIAHDILVFGRGSDPGPNNSRVLSEMGRLRVDAVKKYIEDNSHRFARTVRVLFSAGWAANIGLSAPDMAYREAKLMDDYAAAIGLKHIPGVLFGVQTESNSTVTDALFAARSRFFGSWPFPYTKHNPLGIVAQSGPEFAHTGIGGHMVRCTDATEKVFQLDQSALLPIIADGTDPVDAGLSELKAIKLTRVVFKGAHSDWNIVMRDKALMRTIGVVQKSRKLLHISR
jgi:hypothetical protein